MTSTESKITALESSLDQAKLNFNKFRQDVGGIVVGLQSNITALQSRSGTDDLSPETQAILDNAESNAASLAQVIAQADNDLTPPAPPTPASTPSV